MIEIFTDGGCIGNPGPGGWAYVLTHGTDQKQAYGAEPNTTNNRMELTAVIQALSEARAIDAALPVAVHTDSQYVKNGITTWIHTWKRNGWRTASKQPVKNQEYWVRLDELVQQLNVSWHWVKGHSGNPLNELCDQLVHKGIQSLSV